MSDPRPPFTRVTYRNSHARVHLWERVRNHVVGPVSRDIRHIDRQRSHNSMGTRSPAPVGPISGISALVKVTEEYETLNTHQPKLASTPPGRSRTVVENDGNILERLGNVLLGPMFRDIRQVVLPDARRSAN